MYTLSDIIHLVIIGVIDVSGLVLNIILIVAIFKSTPSGMQTYAILLLNMACSDIVASVCNAATGARVVTVPDMGSQVTIFLGPCGIFGGDFCEVAKTLNNHAMTHSSALLFCAFVFRLRSVTARAKHRHGRVATWFACLAVGIPTATAMAMFLQHKVFTTSPAWSDPRFAAYTIIVFPLKRDFIVALALYYTVAVISLSTFLAAIARFILIWRIRGLSPKSDHRTIAKALSFHIFLPLFYLFGYFIWALDFLGVYHTEWHERSILIVSGLSSPVSACINLYFLRPYRRFLIGLFSSSASSKMRHTVATLPNQPNTATISAQESSY